MKYMGSPSLAEPGYAGSETMTMLTKHPHPQSPSHVRGRFKDVKQTFQSSKLPRVDGCGESTKLKIPSLSAREAEVDGEGRRNFPSFLDNIK